MRWAERLARIRMDPLAPEEEICYMKLIIASFIRFKKASNELHANCNLCDQQH